MRGRRGHTTASQHNPVTFVSADRAIQLAHGATRLVKEEGVIRGFYSGFGPICMKQIPYTMAKFAVQGAAAQSIADNVVGKPLSGAPPI